FRYQLTDHDHGEFWLDHCGALADVEPMGENFVLTMCHDIEDPTFDATAIATNPRAQVRPLHRPPRVPADRSPVCHWTVTIAGDRLTVRLDGDCPAIEDRGWRALLDVDHLEPIDAIVRAIDPRYGCTAVADADGLTVDVALGDVEAPRSSDVELAAISTGATF